MTPKSRPILFSAPMIRAILDGRKSMTRRVVKPQPRQALAPLQISPWEEGVTAFKPGDFGVYREGTPSGRWGLESIIRGKYRIGDTLWVKETWAVIKDDDDKDQRIYKASGVVGSAAYRGVDFGTRTYYGRWKSAIFMPRWASRITLEITAVRVEQVQDITEEDAIAEGISGPHDVGYPAFKIPGDSKPRYSRAAAAFEDLWDSLHAKDGFGWKSNCWVWVLTFKRV